MKISLNIFTNCTLSAPRTDIIRKTYDSFCDTFGNEYPVTVYCDSHPNFKAFKYYFEALQKLFPVVYKTTSLSDGYVKSINNSDADYLFQLEGDWIFFKENINCSLEDICEIMEKFDLYHFRFNKRQNIISGWDIGLNEKNYKNIYWCETSVLSNNPHLLKIDTYKKLALDKIEIKPGSKGIEENLTHVGLVGAIYGGLNYPATVKHQDGRRSR